MAGNRVFGRSPYGGRINTPENDNEKVAPAQTRTVEYACPNGHTTQRTFSADPGTKVPLTWDCPRCRDTANLTTEGLAANLLATVPQPPYRTTGAVHRPARPGAWYTEAHRDQVLTRRTPAELQALLDERLSQLRSGLSTT